jgi:hypothetical protein
MATSSILRKAPEATQSQGAPHNPPRVADSSASRGAYNINGLEALVSDPLYSFSSDASPQFRGYIEKLTMDTAKYIDRNHVIQALGGDVDRPFSATRDGEVVHVVVPQHVKQGDLLGGLIIVLASQIPTCVLHEGSVGWAEPEWSSESRAHLSGIIAGIGRVPDSFSHTSSPADLARISLWITACAAALSVPGGVADAHGDVLPSAVAGSKSASKYITRVMQGLRANISDDNCLKAIDALAMLLKAWQKVNYERSLSIVRKCKLSWSTVLFRGAPTEVIKGKRNKPDQTVVRSPPKPSRSPWLSSAERSELGNLYKVDWSHLDEVRLRWNALSSEQQHRQFNAFVRDVKSHYERLNNISNFVHAKLGKRKHWIELSCKEDGYKPKVKRDESESFLLSAHFFAKKNLNEFDMSVKRVFAPITYLEDTPEGQLLQTWNNCIPTEGDGNNRISAVDFSPDEDGKFTKLWQIWAEMFSPVFVDKRKPVVEATPTEDRNIFSKLLGLGQST